jgi:hypothetical protein
LPSISQLNDSIILEILIVSNEKRKDKRGGTPMTYELLKTEMEESYLLYRLGGEAAERHGAIGYMYADFGRDGREFRNTWFDAQRHLKTPDFKNEFREIIDSLRNDGQKPPFTSRSSLQKFLFAQKGLPLQNNADGFKIQTLNFTYADYCSPSSAAFALQWIS